MLLCLQIIAVVHHKPENANFWASGVRKMGWWETFFAKICFEIFHIYITKNLSHDVAGQKFCTKFLVIAQVYITRCVLQKIL